MVYWIPWPHKHKNRHQDHRNRMSFSRFIVKNVFWWRPSLTSNFRRQPLECRRVSRDFWNLHTQNPPRAKFHASFRKCTPNSHIRPTTAPLYNIIIILYIMARYLGRNEIFNTKYNEFHNVAILLLWHEPPMLCGGQINVAGIRRRQETWK